MVTKMTRMDNLKDAVLSTVPIYGDRLLYNRFLDSDRTFTAERGAKRNAALRTAMYKLPIYLAEGFIVYRTLEHLL